MVHRRWVFSERGEDPNFRKEHYEYTQSQHR
ncbi:uncharacterized protein [Drosophila kikkawai]|uniref:Uncharacterized protein n=1 Tax=Drosophila kikkawai TaxID=30033 RepID=A0ABM3C533_DROKI|nr:uncharacterized protein LOC121502114 [Drosophila kikkawai]